MVAGINPAELKTNQTVVKTDRTGNGKFLLATLPRITISSGLLPPSG
ncbi:hypothetical protein M5E88_14680 [Akkermansia muciniphila]|nr:hypothetical protein M5E88_14680 [Akkermansia muciniphila]